MNECGRHTSNPDHLWQGTVEAIEHVQVARETYRIRFRCPEIAQRMLPGQFVMLRIPGTNDPLLGRPLAMYDIIRNAGGVPESLDIVYQAIGRMTKRLAAIKVGASLELWGPLGNGFPPTETEHLIMVAGGIGQTPFLAMAKQYLGRQTYGVGSGASPMARQVTLCYGCRTADYLACIDDFCRVGVTVHVSTDDGSAGHHGSVIDLIRPAVEASGLSCRIVACGPERMMHAAVMAARNLGLPCQVSLESPMACGIGICFSCVTKIRDASGEWDYRRICVEGPIFDAADVEF